MEKPHYVRDNTGDLTKGEFLSNVLVQEELSANLNNQANPDNQRNTKNLSKS